MTLFGHVPTREELPDDGVQMTFLRWCWHMLRSVLSDGTSTRTRMFYNLHCPIQQPPAMCGWLVRPDGASETKEINF